MSQGQDTDFQHSVERVRRLFLLGLWGIAALWLLLIPGAQMYMGYKAFKIESSSRTNLAGDRLSSYVSGHVETWEYSEDRLRAITREMLRGGEHHVLHMAMTNVRGDVIFDDNGALVPWPWLSTDLEEPVTDGRDVVGMLRVRYSLYALVRPVQVAFLGGLLSVMVLLYFGRFVVNRALDRALHEVDLRGRQLSSRVDELESVREELARQLAEREQDQRQLSHHSASLEMAGNDFAHVAQLTTHHLQEPLRTILSYAQLLLRWHESQGGNTDKADEYVDFIRGGVGRMKVQLKALSNYMSLREADFSASLMDMGGLLEDVAAAKALVLAENNAVLSWDDLPVVVSNRDRLKAVLETLIEASLRWRDPRMRHHIQVSVQTNDEFWLVRVADNGLPLARRDPDHLFQLLVHDEPGHMAVGLAPARLTVFLLGGSLWAEEDEDGQVAFCFILPAPEE